MKTKAISKKKILFNLNVEIRSCARDSKGDLGKRVKYLQTRVITAN